MTKDFTSQTDTTSQTTSKQNRLVKDSIFRDLFQKDEIDGKRNFLELYNAIHHTNLKYEETEIIPKEIPQAVYKTYNNDVCMQINGCLIVLIEHQSTINENMPFRCLEYVTRLYEGIVPSQTRYQSRVHKIPAPEFYVFYNGLEPYPAMKKLKLSDAFMSSSEENTLELTVTVYNIQKMDELKSLPNSFDCDIINQYRSLIELIREYKYAGFEDYYQKAINDSIKNGVLSSYLLRKSQELINMCFAEYDYETDIMVKKQEAAEIATMENKLHTAKNLLDMNILTIEQIAQAIELPVEEIKALTESR